MGGGKRAWYTLFTHAPVFHCVDELLKLLTTSELRVTIDTIYCRAMVYMDDFALITNSLEALQVMLNIMCTYLGKWRYNLNLHEQSMNQHLPKKIGLDVM